MRPVRLPEVRVREGLLTSAALRREESESVRGRLPSEEDHIAEGQPDNLREAQPGLQHQFDERAVPRILGQDPGRSGLALGWHEESGRGVAKHARLDEKREEGADRGDTATARTGGLPQSRSSPMPTTSATR